MQMFYSNKKINKGLATLLTILILVSSFSPIFSRKAEAFIFTDWVNFGVNVVTSITSNALWVKEYGLDSVAYTVTNLIIQKMTASTVNWINSGFKGSPAYITNPDAYFKQLGNNIAGDYIFKNPDLNFLCGPISAKIKLALAQNYAPTNREQRWQCTLTQAGKNFNDFMTSFENGGWDSFFEVSQKTQMNPIGAYLQAETEINLKIANKTNTKTQELSQGRGFLNFKKCAEWVPKGSGSGLVSGGDSEESELDSLNQTGQSDSEEDGEESELDSLNQISQSDSDGDSDLPDESDDSGGSGMECAKMETVTPGSLIENQLNSVLNMGEGRIAAADEINEIVGALLNQLIGRIIGGIGGGLRSLSQPNSSNNNQSFTGQLSGGIDESQMQNYFQKSEAQTNAVIDLPPYNATACREDPTLPECLPPPSDPNNIDNTNDNTENIP